MPGQSEYGLVSWTALPEVAWHYECMATEDGAEWFAGLRAEHPLLDRQVVLRTLRVGQECEWCHTEQIVSPTAIGHDVTGWWITCDSCPTPWRDAVNGWDNEDVIRKLWGLRLRYEVDDWDDAAEAELVALDDILPTAFRKCGACGGQFSLRVPGAMRGVRGRPAHRLLVPLQLPAGGRRGHVGPGNPSG